MMLRIMIKRKKSQKEETYIAEELYEHGGIVSIFPKICGGTCYEVPRKDIEEVSVFPYHGTYGRTNR